MADSVVEAMNVENKIGGSLDCGSTLEVSVSFGRFENDSLSWEKWSSFSPNKYLEEVGKCSTPGSVAQKKAYFEAHYKKIAAQKAEQLEEEENKMDTRHLTRHDQNGEDHAGNSSGTVEIHHLTADDRNGEDHVGNSSESDSDFGRANGQSSTEGVDEPVTNPYTVMVGSQSDESNEIENSGITLECQSSSVDGTKEESDSIIELNKSEAVLVQEDTCCQSSSVDGTKGESDSITDSVELDKSEAVLVQDDTCINGSQDKVKMPPLLVQEDTCVHGSPDNIGLPPLLLKEDAHLNVTQEKVQLQKELNKGKNNPESRRENANLHLSSKFQKITPTKKERNLAGTKKKLESPLLKKSPQVSTPKTSKPASTSTAMSAPLSSMKKANGLPRTKNPSAGESKKLAPSSLHMSLSLGPANSESTSLTTTRKSLIMEKMGDKDIVKRAFKTFQNNFNLVQSSGSGYDGSSGRKVSTAGPAKKLSTSSTPRKENEGIRRETEKMDAQRVQLGRSWNSPSAGLLKGAGMDQRNAKPAPSSSGLRSDERAERTKEFFKKLEDKTYAKEVDKTRLSSKSKEEKEDEIKKLRQSLNFKSPVAGFYRGNEISKSHSSKEGVKKIQHHRPAMHA